MVQVRVGVLGYGVIGRRAADAVRAQPDMEVVGVAGRPTSFSLRAAQRHGYPVFVTAPARARDAARRWCEIQGQLEDLLDRCQILLDCTPSGVPAVFTTSYDRHPNLIVIVQGGESHAFGGVSFNAFANYHQAVGKKRIRVISCSSTGITRFVFALHQAFGLRQAFVSLTRRGADPGKTSQTPFNALRPTPGPSHHAADVQDVLPQVDLFSMSVDVPTTLAHVISFQADLAGTATESTVLEALDGLPRMVVGRGLRSTADVAEHFQDLGRYRRDRPEIYVWQDSVIVERQTVYATISVHMESITIPETVDCIRASLGCEPDHWASVFKTDCAMRIAKDSTCYQRPAGP